MRLITIIRSPGLMAFGALLLVLVLAVPFFAQEERSIVSPQDQVAAKNGASETKDASKKSVPAPSSAYTWKGAYIGGHVGYGWGKGDTLFTPLPTAAQFSSMAPVTIKVEPRGVIGGVQGGYNWQTGHFVAGGEADFSWSDMKSTVTVTPIITNSGTPFAGAAFQRTHQNTDWFGTVRARAGAAYDRFFFYGTGGLAYARVNYSAMTDFRPVGTIQYPAAISRTKTGWTVGGGAEVAINKHWSFKAEYLYYDLRKTSFTANPVPANPPFQVAYEWQTKAHTFNTGINYRF